MQDFFAGSAIGVILEAESSIGERRYPRHSGTLRGADALDISAR